MSGCLQVIYSMLNQLLSFITPWGFTFGVVIVAPIVVILMIKGLKMLLWLLLFVRFSELTQRYFIKSGMKQHNHMILLYLLAQLALTGVILLLVQPFSLWFTVLSKCWGRWYAKFSDFCNFAPVRCFFFPINWSYSMVCRYLSAWSGCCRFP